GVPRPRPGRGAPARRPDRRRRGRLRPRRRAVGRRGPALHPHPRRWPHPHRPPTADRRGHPRRAAPDPGPGRALGHAPRALPLLPRLGGARPGHRCDRHPGRLLPPGAHVPRPERGRHRLHDRRPRRRPRDPGALRGARHHPRRDGGRGDRRGRRGRDRRSAAGQRGAGAAHCADHRDRDEAPTGRARGPRPPGRGAARRDGDGDRHRKRRRHRGARGVGRRQRRRPQRAGRGLGRRWCARRRSYARDARDGRRRGGRRGPSRPRRGLTPAAAPPDSCRSRGSAGVSEVQSPPEGGSLVAHRALRRRIPVANAGLGSIGPRGGGDAHTEGLDDETTGRRSRKSPWQRVGSVLGTATVLLLLVGGYFGYAAFTGPSLEGEVLLHENDTVELGPNGWVAVTEDASWWPWSNDRELVLHNLVTGEETTFPDNPSVGLVLPGGGLLSSSGGIGIHGPAGEQIAYLDGEQIGQGVAGLAGLQAGFPEIAGASETTVAVLVCYAQERELLSSEASGGHAVMAGFRLSDGERVWAQDTGAGCVGRELYRPPVSALGAIEHVVTYAG